MARKSATWKRKNLVRERSHERACGSNTSSRPSAALPVCGARKSLDCGYFLHLFVADRAGVLVAVALLACMADGRRADFANFASVGRSLFLLRCDADVRLLGAADAHDTSGQAVVAFAQPLHSKRR